MNRIIAKRLAHLEERHLPAGPPPLCVQRVSLDLACLDLIEQARACRIADQVNARVDELVAEHGPGILRPHSHCNDALRALPTTDLEWLDEVMSQ